MSLNSPREGRVVVRRTAAVAIVEREGAVIRRQANPNEREKQRGEKGKKGNAEHRMTGWKEKEEKKRSR